MSLMKRSGNRQMGMISHRDDFFENMWGNDFLNTFFAKGTTVPAMNIEELDDRYQVDIAAPGMKKEDFDVEVNGNSLEISAKSETKNVEEKKNYMRKEFSFKSFSRSFQLPENINKDNIKAEYEDGILSIELPKKEMEEKDTKKIKIL